MDEIEDLWGLFSNLLFLVSVKLISESNRLSSDPAGMVVGLFVCPFVDGGGGWRVGVSGLALLSTWPVEGAVGASERPRLSLFFGL